MPAVELTSSGTISSTRTRIRGITLSHKSGGTVVLKNGGAAGTALWSFTGANASNTVYIPLDDMLFPNGAYAALTDAHITALVEG